MKDVKNMKMKEERKGGNRIKLKGIRLKLMRKKGICLICLVLDDFFIISLLLLNIVMIEWHLLSIMKDVKNTKTKEERKDDNQIKLKSIRLKLMQKKGIYLICLILDRIFLLYLYYCLI